MDFVFTNDDAGGGGDERQAVEGFRRIVEFLDRHGVGATFFWLARARDAGFQPGNERAQWRETLQWAIARGHDVQLHVSLGYLLGYPMLDNAERKRFGAWSVAQRLQDAIEIYEQTFGAKPLILRPHGDFRHYRFPQRLEDDLDDMLASVVRADIARVSLPLPMSLKALGLDGAQGGLRLPFTHPSGAINYPWVIEDCTPRRSVRLDGALAPGEREKTFDQWLEMATAGLDRHLRLNAGPCLMNSHWHVMCRDWPQTQHFFELFFERVAGRGCRCVTLAEAIRPGAPS